MRRPEFGVVISLRSNPCKEVGAMLFVTWDLLSKFSIALDNHADINVGQQQQEATGSIVVEVRRVKFYMVKQKHKKYSQA